MFPHNACCVLLIFLDSCFALVTIIGGTGTIGSKVVEVFRKYPRLVTYRRGKEHTVHSWRQALSDDGEAIPEFFELDLRDLDHSTPSIPPWWCQGSPGESDVLVNVAGVCLYGRDPGAMHASLAINTKGPIFLSKLAIRAHERLTVINVSSGEGELCNINSEIVKELHMITTSAELDAYIELLQNTYKPTLEYAHGLTPMYSLSKAILNKSTQLLHSEHGSTTDCNIRIIACCPDNVASPMSTEEELEDTVTAEYAAQHIFKYATEPDKFPGGRFYRNGAEIPW